MNNEHSMIGNESSDERRIDQKRTENLYNYALSSLQFFVHFKLIPPSIEKMSDSFLTTMNFKPLILHYIQWN